MSEECPLCHGEFKCLRTGSHFKASSRLLKIHQKFASYLGWWLENMGWRATVKHVLLRTPLTASQPARQCPPASGRTETPSQDDVLALRPGECVEVKTVDEIMATLDANRRHKGLLWMTGMNKYCGRRYRVFRRVDKILLETNGELRNMKNTVLLEGVMCDGKAFGGCDRSCFHFWREAWLRRCAEN